MTKKDLAETYQKALRLIETFGIKPKETKIMQVDVGFFLEYWQRKEKMDYNTAKFFAKHTFGVYDKQDDAIYILQGQERNLGLIIHEILHSSTILDSKNSPKWISEGLVKAITKEIMKNQEDIPIQNLYQKEYEDFWLEKLQKEKDKIINAFIASDLKTTEKILESDDLKNRLMKYIIKMERG
ncbi:MAG: hypothetical protein ACE5KE_12105 [Methanosarcinales archaeon]